MKILIILAYNEELYLEKTINNHVAFFDKVVVINDKSSDSTSKILQRISKENPKIKIITNKKNYGPGKSMDIGSTRKHSNLVLKLLLRLMVIINLSLKTLKALLKLSDQNINLISLNVTGFGAGGIEGDIPKIRYFGNAFASLLIKAITGKWSITDPLNGLFLFSSNTAREIVRYLNFLTGTATPSTST